MIKNRNCLSEFCYENGYVLRGTDLGGLGVKIELVHEDQGGGAIILPPGKAQECAGWLLQTLGQSHQNLPEELADILERIVTRKELSQILRRSDKKKLRDALRALKN